MWKGNHSDSGSANVNSSNRYGNIRMSATSSAEKVNSAATTTAPAGTGIGTGTSANGNGNDNADGNNDGEGTGEIDGDVAYDEDDMPIPQGIVAINEDQLDNNETLDLNLENANKQIWLVRLTPQLADLWRSEEFMNGQKLGNIKIPKADRPGADKRKILLELNEEIPEHKRLEKQYELKLIKQVVENEYAFSESQFEQFRQRLMYRTQVVNMPNQPRMRALNKEALNHEANWTRKIRNYKKEAQYRDQRSKDPNFKSKRAESGMGTTYISDDEKDDKKKQSGRRSAKFEKFDKFRKFIPYAKTIPKKTEIVGKVVHECQVIPTKLVADNKLRMIEQRKRLALMAKRKTINYIKTESVGLMHGRATPNIQTGSTITLSKELAMKKEIAKADGRAARLERDVLMNLLFKLFNEYEYWTMKGLREKTNQPEAFLKECIESIAVMERKGPYALKWRLKDEYRKSIDVEKKVKRGTIEEDEEAERSGDGERDDEDDEEMDDVEMEDIAAV
jgi:transcription initiation factor TFIIF subunit beta